MCALCDGKWVQFLLYLSDTPGKTMFSTNGKQIIVFCFKLALFLFWRDLRNCWNKEKMKELYFCKCLILVLGLNVGLEDPVSCCRVTGTVIQLCSINDYIYYTILDSHWTNSFGIMYCTTCQWLIQEKSLDQSSMWAWIRPQTLSGTEQHNCMVQWFLLDLLPCKLTPVIPFSLEGEV